MNGMAVSCNKKITEKELENRRNKYDFGRKITEERREKWMVTGRDGGELSVSRQAVSKWESAQSTPDLQKVLRLAEIFGVSTDYLLKDELKSETGTEILEYAAEESSVRSVSMEEANAFMEWRRKAGPTLAGAVALCIISPALLIFLAGLSDSHIGNISENMATGAGISALLLLVRRCCDFRILQYSRTAV
ncbi:MAG: helix-turn-helix domain-containing protein [Fusicatenibacter saccharivorans]